MFCSRCGAPANPTNNFCPVCASPLVVTTVAAGPPPRPPLPPQPPPRTPRVEVTSWDVAKQLDDVVIGNAFAFFGTTSFKKPALAWVQRLFGGQERPRIVSLVGHDPAHLPGAKVDPVALAGASLASVTSDKALYREGRDEVRLLALDPFAPHADTALEIRVSGAEYGKRPVKLDARGAAAVTLRDLPAGDYEVRLRGAPDDAPACTFTVAAYKLAPLVAHLADRSLEGDRLAVRLRLESFGAPVDGKVQIDLTDAGQRLATLTVEARDGAADAAFRLAGKGPHALQIQLVADPARTATVPIVGSRIEERSRTVFSTLGAEVTGALLPSPGAVEVRGIHLEEGATRSSPFRLDRVDARRARLFASTAVQTARVVVIDPRVPARRANAVDVDTARHPGSYDEGYRRGEALFKEKKLEEALAAFEEARAAVDGPAHPNYAYWIACVRACLGRTDAALAALDEAIRDGWKDFDLLAKDDDLASLRGHPVYEARKTGGATELVFDDVAAGTAIEIDVPSPVAVLAIGAFADGAPWEGWAAVLAPPAIAPRVEVPRAALPGGHAAITVDTGSPDDAASVYVVVKDARLLSHDTPQSRLAGGIKAFVERASKALAVGRPTLKLSDNPGPPPFPYFGPPPVGAPLPPGFGPPPPPPAPGAAFGPPPPAPAFGRAAPGFGPPPATVPGGFGPPPPAPGGFGPPPVAAAAPAPAAAPAAAPAGAPTPGPGPYRQAPPAPPPPGLEEPEVLFAGMVETRGGRASVGVRLGPDFADYLVEAFVTTGLDWAPVEARFRAEKETFVSLDVPAFVHVQDAAVGRVHVGSRGPARVTVTCDGAPIPLLVDGKPLAPGAPLPAGRSEVSFIAGPGLYEASIDDGSGRDTTAKRVDVPGKIRRLARGVRLLSSGEHVSRSADPSIVGLRVLPGLDRPFRALVDATADYGHACCEQTAAKLLTACSMYALADSAERRDRAESIIVAGVKREASMWLPGVGFKMYPDMPPRPDTYYGPKAARYLHNLALLTALRPGRGLAAVIGEGLAMARDTTAAYRLDWPPRRPATCEDAYAALRFGGAAADGIHVVRNHAASARGLLGGGGAVGMRVETAYASAVLLSGGGADDRALALRLANLVIEQLGEHGRLYSTLDSVAAVALMSELTRAGVVGGAGKVEIDGQRLGTADAVKHEAEIREVRAVEGVAAVEVTRQVEEDWSRFDAALPVRVALEKDGRPTRRLNALDAVDLVVTLESGYKAGDICWVCLPDALSRVTGGGQVKRFSVDFEGKNQVRIPLAATGVTVNRRGEPAPSFYAVCVRNMFEEERGGNPGMLDVTVAPAGASGAFERAVSVFRGLFQS